MTDHEFYGIQIIILGVMYLFYVHRYDIRSFFRYNFPSLYSRSMIKMTEELDIIGLLIESASLESSKELPEVFFEVTWNLEGIETDLVFVKINDEVYFDFDMHLEEGGKNSDLAKLLEIKEDLASYRWN
mgnify:FL=1